VYPTISHLIDDLFGFYFPLPIQTFGFFVALAFLSAAFVFGLELKRKEQGGLLNAIKRKVLKGAPASFYELFINSFLGFVFGFKLWLIVEDYGAFVDDPQGAILSLEGNFIAGLVGALFLGYWKYREKDKEKLDKPQWETIDIYPHQLVGDITIIAAISGLIGAKLFHNLEYIEDFMSDPIGALLSFSGLTFYGGLIFGTGAIIWYLRKNKIPIIHVADAVAPALILAYGVGRIGCQMAGDGDWGITNMDPQPAWLSFLPNWFWAFDYPGNVINEGIPMEGCEGKYCYVLAHPVYPTPLYESIASIFLFGILWLSRAKIQIAGVMFCTYLIMNGVERFFIEKIRVNAIYDIFGREITQAEIISALLVMGGVFGIWYLYRKNR